VSCYGSAMSSLPGLPRVTVPSVVAWLSELTSQSENEIVDTLLDESKRIGRTVQKAAHSFGLVPHLWNQQLMDFYESTDAFLFETATWNFTPMKCGLREFIVKELQKSLPPGSRVLCFGDGMGFDSDAIARAGFDVTCFEVSGPCLNFAAKLFQQNQSQVVIHTDFDSLSDDSFDAIVCLDVLEHVPDPPALVTTFYRWLKADSLFLVHAPYYHVDETRPTHLESNRKYAAQIETLYETAGFQLKNIGGLLLDPLVFAKNPGTPVRAPRLKKFVGKTLTRFCRQVRSVPSLTAPLFTKPDRGWIQDLKEYQGQLKKNTAPTSP